MATAPIFINTYRTQQQVLIAAHSTTVAMMGWVSGASGSRVHGIAVVATDTGANTLLVYHAERMTAQSAMGTASFIDNGGSADTITRTSGSFITDGWKIGDRMFVADPTTLANGFFVTLTAVVALTLSFATGSVSSDVNEALPSGAVIYRLAQLHLSTLAINAGNAASTDALDGLITDFPIADATPDRFLTIGALDGLAFSVGTAVGASPDRVDITCWGGDY